MIEIIMDNVFIEIKGASKECEFELWNNLSFTIEEFGNPYPKIRHLFNRKTKKTYAGLLNYIIEIMDERGEEYKIIDTRTVWEPNADYKLVDFIDEAQTIPLSFRPYQKTIVDNATERECIQAATGAGKTFMMAALAAKFNVKPLAVFADKLTLVEQLKTEFEKFLGRPIGIVGGGKRQIEDITIYSIQSATEEDVKDAKMIMIDECLEYNQQVLMASGEYKKIGDLVKKKSDEFVMSYNHKTKKLEPKSIISHSETKLYDNDKTLMKFIIRKQNNELDTIKCTNNHKIWIVGKNEYVRADQIKKGQRILSYLNGELQEGNVMYFEQINTPDNMFVYDIGVEDNHNFICENVLVHNCHHIPSNTVSEVSRWCKNAYYRIGVSATPWRDAGDDLLIDAVLAKRKPENNINASKLIELGYLVPCTIYFVPFKQQFKGKNYHKVYEEAIVNNKERNESIVKIALKMKATKNTKTLILIQRIEHGEKLQEMLLKKMEEKAKVINVTNDNGKQFAVRVKNVEFLSGQDDSIKRKAVFQAVKEGFVDVLIGSTIADEGLDLPNLDCLILAGGGKSSTRAFQRVGRVLRLAEDKKRAIVFDFEDGTPMLNRHAKVRKKLYETEPIWEIKYLNPNLLK